MSPRTLAAAAVLALAAARSAAAQAPLPADLPWEAPPSLVRAKLARLGLVTRGPTARTDTMQVFTSNRGGVAAELRARYREGRLWHVFYTVQGDSASVQHDLDASASTLSARMGAPRHAAGSRVWILPGGRRFALPQAAVRLPNGRFSYAAAYHRGG